MACVCDTLQPMRAFLRNLRASRRVSSSRESHHDQTPLLYYAWFCSPASQLLFSICWPVSGGTNTACKRRGHVSSTERGYGCFHRLAHSQQRTNAP